MSLRTKIITIYSIASITSLFLIYFLISYIVDYNFRKIEQEHLKEHVTSVVNTIDNETRRIYAVSIDWGIWDDTYNFIENKNEEYISSNLVGNTYTSLDLNFFIYLDKRGNTVYSEFYDLDTDEIKEMPTALTNYIFSHDKLISPPGPTNNVCGVILVEEDNIIICSQAIIQSNEEGPIRGTLIMGRYLDNTKVKNLSEITKQNISVNNYDAVDPLIKQAKEALNQGEEITTKEIDDKTIRGYTIVKDIESKPAFILSLSYDRQFHQKSQETIKYIIFVLIGSGLIVGFITTLASSVVLSKLTKLKDGLNELITTKDTSLRINIPGRDEVADLSKVVNEALDFLEKNRKEIKINKEKVINEIEILEEENKQLEKEKEIIKNEKEAIEKQAKELEKSNSVMIDRELKMIALKKEIEKLEKQLGKNK